MKAIQASLTQICLPFVENKAGKSPDEQLAGLIGAIKKKYRKSAQWSYQAKDLAPLEAAISAVGEGSEAASTLVAADQIDALAELEKLMATQAETASQMESTEIPETLSFASVEVPVEEGKKKPKRKAKSKAKTRKDSSKKKAK